MLNDKKIGVLILAYNALPHLAKALKRIPPRVWEQIDEVAVFDDASSDGTYEIAHEFKLTNALDKLSVYRNNRNLGYGGNQKKGFAYFSEKGFDIVVLLHGDGQYAPEILADLYMPLVDNKFDVVLGSRMMNQYGGPLRGGMPLYKLIGNKILTYWENKTLGMHLTEFHSGYRAYSIEALRHISLSNCTDDFHFDTEIIVKLNHMGFRFLEVPIPTYYGTEICYVDGLKYAKNVYQTVREYIKTVNGFTTSPMYQEFETEDYPLKPYEFSSHTLVSQIIAGIGQRILDVGCGSGPVEQLADTAHNSFVGIDRAMPKRNRERFSDFVVCDLEHGLPIAHLSGQRFGYILLLDVLEHLVNADQILREVHQIADEHTVIVISVPNIANIYARLSLLLGKFNYANRGILDHSHVRFFTKASLARMVQDHGFEIQSWVFSNIPLNELFGQRRSGWLLKLANWVMHFFTTLFSGLLAYQIILLLRKEHNIG